MLREDLEALMGKALASACSAGHLPPRAAEQSNEIQDAKNPDHGDFVSAFALGAAKECGIPPRQIAQILREALLAADYLEAFQEIEIAGPGFLNMRLSPRFVSSYLPKILERGDELACSSGESPKRIHVEFVSVNPNGPITVGSGRGAAFGDVLASVLSATGEAVHREYYINDGVNSEQMRLFAESARASALNAELPEGGYRGEYVKEVADRVLELMDSIGSAVARALEEMTHASLERHSRLRRLAEALERLKDLRANLDARETVAAAETMDLKTVAEEIMTERQRAALEMFGTRFDSWFGEQYLHETGSVERAIEKLIEKGDAYWAERPEDQEAEPEDAGGGAALWLRSTAYGDDKDRVIKRADGRFTYLASDIAYLEDKLGRRDFDKSYIILGPDHHGYIGRMNAVCRALGYPPDRFEIIIYQIVRFLKEGKPAPMRKRDGNIYELADLVSELGAAAAPNTDLDEQLRIGRDVARFFYLMRSHETHMDFDIDLATSQSEENPVFYAQYAYARICSVMRKAEDAVGPASNDFDHSLLVHPTELQLIKKVLDLAWEVRRCARDYGVHRLTTYAVELARGYHHFYDSCRVIQPDNRELSQARLALCVGVRNALSSCLALLGVSAPMRMEREPTA